MPRHLNKCNLDRHWKPFISRCAYCDMPYLIITKAETFHEDQKFLGQLAGVEFPSLASHPSSGGSTSHLARDYFSQLDKDTVERLTALYQVDLDMFGYTSDIYTS